MTESHDPWEDARKRQREEVAAIFAKLGLSEDVDSHRRVRAVLLYLAES